LNARCLIFCTSEVDAGVGGYGTSGGFAGRWSWSSCCCVEGRIVVGVFDGMVVVVIVVEGDNAVEMVLENIVQEKVEGNIPPAETVDVNTVVVESFAAGDTLAKDRHSRY
jgi:hypothetical protein